ncbi:MAG: hypothetical protein LW716_00210, partial [Microcystis sp. 53602_E8]|nr:hypothetical protein [Microcystis sp. 53602_E8]
SGLISAIEFTKTVSAIVTATRHSIYSDSIQVFPRELHKKDDPIVKWFDKGFPQTTLANGEVD